MQSPLFFKVTLGNTCIYKQMCIERTGNYRRHDIFARVRWRKVNIDEESSRFVSDGGAPLVAMHSRGLHRTPDVIDLSQIGIRDHLARRGRACDSCKRVIHMSSTAIGPGQIETRKTYCSFVYDLCGRATRIVAGGYLSLACNCRINENGKRETRERVE